MMDIRGILDSRNLLPEITYISGKWSRWTNDRKFRFEICFLFDWSDESEKKKFARFSRVLLHFTETVFVFSDTAMCMRITQIWTTQIILYVWLSFVFFFCFWIRPCKSHATSTRICLSRCQLMTSNNFTKFRTIKHVSYVGT